MNKLILYIFLFLSNILYLKVFGQVSPPQLRCISVSTPTTAILTWIVPMGEESQFSEYEIWTSPTQLGIYKKIGSVNTYSQTTFTHNNSNVGIQSQYYYVKTIGISNTSRSSDTLRSLFINLSNSGNGIINLNWNPLKTPNLNSNATTYTVSRQAPSEPWTPLYTGSKLNYKDTTTFVCKIFYNYKVEMSNQEGCRSTSNLKGDTCKNLFPPEIIVLDSVSVKPNGSAVIGWPKSKSLDVNKYIVYNDINGFLTPVDTILGIDNTNYTLSTNNSGSSAQAYCISAGDACGNFSIPSKSHQTIFLNLPIYDLCTRTAKLKWSDYKDLNGGVLQYDIYRSNNGAEFKLIGNSKTTSYTDVQLLPSIDYCYFVRVRNTSLTISASSNIQCFKSTGLPGPDYAYINSVSVVPKNNQIKITYSIDKSKPYKGCTIYKSTDGKNFTEIGYSPFSLATTEFYIDKDVKPSQNNYYYKLQVFDDCNNPGVYSGIAKSIVLLIKNDPKNSLINTLTWDDYSGWNSGTQSYSIYRSMNDTFGKIPIAIIPFGSNTYLDDVSEYYNYEGKFSYYIMANENAGNPLGIENTASSNVVEAYIDAKIFVPNAFAPKGKNNIWLPITKYVTKTEYKVTVFNRWGSVVFKTDSDLEGWDGENASDDIYIYLINYKNSRGEYIQEKGHIYLIR